MNKERKKDGTEGIKINISETRKREWTRKRKEIKV